MLVAWTQGVYLLLSVGMTVYVAYSLKNNGRVFLLKTFDGDESITDSINSLLVVGFYLVNIGWVLVWTKYGIRPTSVESSIELVTTKVGVVMLILGFAHFVNLRIFWKIQQGDALGKREKKVV